MKNTLGEYLGELKGKITGRRVLDVTNGPNLEVNVTRGGNLKGVEVTELVTYCATLSSDGTHHGQGEGIIMTKDGSETTTHTGGGIGHLTGPAKLRYVGSLFFGTSKGKLEFLNNSVVVFEVEIDLETLDDSIKLWEWK